MQQQCQTFLFFVMKKPNFKKYLRVGRLTVWSTNYFYVFKIILRIIFSHNLIIHSEKKNIYHFKKLKNITILSSTHRKFENHFTNCAVLFLLNFISGKYIFSTCELGYLTQKNISFAFLRCIGVNVAECIEVKEFCILDFLKYFDFCLVFTFIKKIISKIIEQI